MSGTLTIASSTPGTNDASFSPSHAACAGTYDVRFWMGKLNDAAIREWINRLQPAVQRMGDGNLRGS